MTAPTSPVAGWYPDPALTDTVRYFDGAGWTAHVAPAPHAVPAQYAAPAQQAYPGYGSSVLPGGAAPQDHLGAHPSDPVHWLVPTGRTWQSVLAGYLGVVSLLLWFVGPVSVGVGVWALRATARSHGHGRGRAIFAIVVGVAATCLAVLWVAGAWS